MTRFRLPRFTRPLVIAIPCLTVLLALGCPPAEVAESEHAGCEEHEEAEGEGAGAHPGEESELDEEEGAALHAAALAVLVPTRGREAGSCAASSCHDKEAARAHLSLRPGITDLRKLLVGRESCETHLMLVSGEGGEHALEHSWLWQKLTAHAAPSGELEADPEWGANAICGQREGMPYGARMPWTGDNEELSERKLTAVRRWICAGAPGPAKEHTEDEEEETHDEEDEEPHAPDEESVDEPAHEADEEHEESEMGTSHERDEKDDR